MKNFYLSLLLLTCLATRIVAVENGPTPYPDPMNEAAWPGKGPIRVFEWMTKNRKTFWEQREQDRGAVVFVGDSLTANWKNFASAFPGVKVANRGIGGDVSRGVLFRFKEDVLDLNPRGIVLCVGTNDLSAHHEPAQVIENITGLITMARAQNPQVPFVLCTVPPRDDPRHPTPPGFHADLNARIRQLATGQNVTLLDLFQGLGTPEGLPVPEYFGRDRLHLAEPGYQRWAELLRPVFERLGIKPTEL